MNSKLFLRLAREQACSQKATTVSRLLDPNDAKFPKSFYAKRPNPDPPMVGIAGLIADKLADQDNEAGRQAVEKDLGPENPFDDYYVLSKIEERGLSRGRGAIYSIARTV